MVKTLQKHGDSQALVIDGALIEAMGITVDTPLQITVSGSTLIITPVHTEVGVDDVRSSIEKLRPRYGGMLRKLAE